MPGDYTKGTEQPELTDDELDGVVGGTVQTGPGMVKQTGPGMVKQQGPGMVKYEDDTTRTEYDKDSDPSREGLIEGLEG